MTLQLPKRLVPGDALDTNAWGKPGMDLGLLGIDFDGATQRVNGWVNTDDSDSEFPYPYVAQSFGNCPQYIPSRQWWTPTPPPLLLYPTTARKKLKQLASSFTSPLRSSRSLRQNRFVLEQAGNHLGRHWLS
jgi:hypothetical protein